MKQIEKIILIILLTILTSACQALKDGLEGNKKSKSAEEFLIQKKNPLVLPPDFSKMPTPINDKKKEETTNFEIEDILGKKNKKAETNEIVNTNSNIKKSVLEKIKNN